MWLQIQKFCGFIKKINALGRNWSYDWRPLIILTVFYNRGMRYPDLPMEQWHSTASRKDEGAKTHLSFKVLQKNKLLLIWMSLGLWIDISHAGKNIWCDEFLKHDLLSHSSAL